MKKKIFTLLIGLIVAAVAISVGYVWFSLRWSYSSGERAGYVQKFSHKGWLCKTWEGELTMMPIAGSIPEKFLFSVRDDQVAQRVNSTMGKRVNLKYEQHRGVPTTCFGETEYFITDVKVLE